MTLTIKRLGRLGDGIAEGPVYVPRTLPGEIVEGALDGDRLTRPRIVQPSDQRVRPACTHYARCGGCALMHASAQFVADWKAEVVRTALAAQDIDAEIDGVDTSPPRSRRRAVIAGRRTKSGVIVGFHGPASSQIVPIPRCHLLVPELIAALPLLEQLTGLAGSRRGEMTFHVTHSPAGLDLAVGGGRDPDAALTAEILACARAASVARLTWNGEVLATFDRPWQEFGGIAVTPPPGGFLQATVEGEAALRSMVLEATGRARRVVDLFAGCGTFSLPLATRSEVHAVEGSDEMIAALDEGWRNGQGLRRVTTEVRDLFRRPLRADELNRFDAVVIDPPRSGAAAQVGEIARSAVSRVVHVSCNPVTFARDARQLAQAGFGLKRLRVIDQFRWSAHVELVAVLDRD